METQRWGTEAVSARVAQYPALTAAGTRSQAKEGEKMRVLGARSQLRTERAAWAPAPGQSLRDRNVVSISQGRHQPVVARPLTPDLAQLSRGPGHCKLVSMHVLYVAARP